MNGPDLYQLWLDLAKAAALAAQAERAAWAAYMSTGRRPCDEHDREPARAGTRTR